MGNKYATAFAAGAVADEPALHANFSNNRLTGLGASRLLRALRLDVLQSLVLSHNTIGMQGCKALAAAASVSVCLGFVCCSACLHS